MASHLSGKSGQLGSQSLPYRTTGDSVSDDEAVPEGNPTDVSSAKQAMELLQ